MAQPVVFIVSDSLGETAELVARAAASQFDGHRATFHRFPYVDRMETVDEIVDRARREERSLIVHTLVVEDLRRALNEKAQAAGIPVVDIMGPMMAAWMQVAERPPRLQPGLRHQLDEEYFRRIEAVEFAVKYDDGKDPRGLLQADIVLLGVSRTSKTPVSMYLAHRMYKVANVPLVPEVEPPAELYKVPRNRLVGLIIRPEVLQRIRRERLRAMGLSEDSSYGSMRRIQEELAYAQRVFRELGCPVVDVTNKAVEETANTVLEILARGERDDRGRR
ncbi:MAG: kinase/pyrophosphorylase [Symbiobacteriaceae bacterium]|nr:MAG: phosphoenolpyruvate synthase regulatory protein [Bacillota bacterium]